MPIFTRGIVGPDVSIAGVGEQNVGSNVGGGAGVYRDKSGVTLNFRSLIGGTGITVTQNVDDIDIALSGAIGEANDAVNVGAGTGNIFRDKTGVDLNLKTLIGGTNVNIVDGSDDITINVPSAAPSGTASGMLSGTYPGPDVINFTLSGEATGDITFHNAGQWEVLAAGTSGQILTTQGPGLAPTWETITPGETNLGANVGGNPGLVFRDKTGSTLNFRSIGAGSNVVVNTVGDSISISVPDAPPSGGAGGDLDGFFPNPDVIDLTMTGEVQGAVLYFNGLNWVVLTPGTSGYALLTQGGSADPVWGFVGDINGAANLGTGTGDVYSGKNGSALEFRSLEGLGNIVVDTVGDNVTIDGSNLIGRGESAGGDLGGTYPDPTVTDLTITDEQRGSILYFNGSNWVQLAPGDAEDILKSGGAGADPYWSDVGADGEINVGLNVGIGLPWYRNKTGVFLNFRTAIAGTNVTITNLGDELSFDVLGAEPIGVAGGELTGTYPNPDLANIYFDNAIRNAFGGVGAGQRATTTGEDNAAWGDGALGSLVDGIQNFAGGSRALESLISGSNSTAGGFRALGASLDGNNTAFGSLAGANLINGTRNTFFGEAGSALVQGSDNLLGGFAAGSNLTQGNRNIVLGSSLLVPNSVGDDQLVIGSLVGLIFGNLSAGLLAIGGTTIPTGSAELALRSTNKGFIFNRLTTAQRDAIPSPVNGMHIYNVDNDRLEYYESGSWQAVGAAAATDPNAVHVNASGEISAVTLKASPVSGDYLLIEDSADGNSKKRITVGSISGGGGGLSGYVRIRDVTVQSEGTITNKVYQDTAQTILQSCTTSDADISISIRSSYPLVDVGGNAAELTLDGVGQFYYGDVDITIPGSGDIVVQIKTPDDTDGALDTVLITLDEPPELLSLSFTGGYPGSQTELKEDDVYSVTGTTDKNADAIEVIDWEAGKSQIIPITPGVSFTEDITIADRGNTAVLRPARIRARDAVSGAWGPTRDTNFGGGSIEGTDVVNCNNLHPSVSIGVITYPGIQQALKGSEGATVANTCSNFDTIAYDDPTTSELSITNPVTYEASKSVTRVGGTYNISTNNFRIIANRAANDASTTVQDVVNIANVAAQITVGEPAARLRSGGNDGTSIQNHIITITSNQQLLSAPSMDEDTGGGTFIGSWSGGPTVYQRTLQVHDDDIKATYNWQNLSATNLSGLITTVITGDDSYVLGGFVPRTVTWAAFQQATLVNVAVVDYSKIQAGLFEATNQQSIRHTPQGDHADAVNEYTVDSPLNTNPQTVWWNDYLASQSNSGTADLYDFEEIV